MGEEEQEEADLQTPTRRNRIVEAGNRILLDSLDCRTLSDVAKAGLIAIEQTIGSQFGLVAVPDEEGNLDIIALSYMGGEVIGKERELAQEQTVTTLVKGCMSQLIITGEPVVVNEPVSNITSIGATKGHLTIDCYLGVPIGSGTKIIGLVGLVNKPGGFTSADVEDVGMLCISLAEVIRRKRSEDDRDDNLRLYKGLFSNTVFGMAYHRMLVDEAGIPVDYVFIDMNPAFEALTGLEREKIIGRKVTEVLPGIVDDEFDWIGTYGNVALTGEPVTFSQYFPPLDRWYLVSAYSPRKYYFVATFVDITSERRLQEALKESETFAIDLFENAPVSLWELDLSAVKSKAAEIGSVDSMDLERHMHDHTQTLSEFKSAVRVVRANPRTLELFGAKTLEDFQIHLPNASVQAGVFHRVVPALVRQQNLVMTEGVLATLDGRNIDVALKAKVVPGCETTLERVIVSAIDLTVLKQAEKQMKSLNEELDRRVKERTAQLETANSELEAFSYSVSHDLRAPLRAMDGFSSKMLEAYCDNLDNKGVHYLERIRAAAQRMGTMIDDLLRLSRINRAEVTRELVDMTSMAREIAEELRSTDESRQAEFVIEDDIAANADKGLLRCALDNLMGNAWKFSKECQYARIEVASQRKGKNTVYFVRDNGVGFDMKYSGKLFVPFQRLHTRNEFEGSGVGLATAYRIIKRHGGEIWAESSPGQGATFYFTVSTDKSSDV